MVSRIVEEYGDERAKEAELSGIVLGKQESARNMLKIGLGTHAQIFQVTGLSVEDIQALAASVPEPVLA
jgi:hypothetical protein